MKPQTKTVTVSLAGGDVQVNLAQREGRNPIKVGLVAALVGIVAWVISVQATDSWSFLSLLGIHQSSLSAASADVPASSPGAAPAIQLAKPSLITFRRGDQVLFSCEIGEVGS